MKWPKLKRDWEGRHVRLLRQITNRGGDIFPKDTTMRIEGYYRGLDLLWVDGPQYHNYVRGVAIEKVELLPAPPREVEHAPQ